MSNDDYIVFTRRLRDYLLENDCKLLDVRASNKKEGFEVYVFEKSPQLLELVRRYSVRVSK